MNSLRSLQPLHIALIVIGSNLGMLLAAAVLLFSQRRQLVAFDCHDERDVELEVPELIIQAGPEFLLAFPSLRDSENSFLVSRELRDPAMVPARWRFQKSELLEADPSGFRLRDGVGKDAAIVRFSAEIAQWSRQGAGGEGATHRQCRRLSAIPAKMSALNAVPLVYLTLRPWPLSALNPDLSDAGFRLTLARALSGRPGASYSIYKLLAPLPRPMLTSADEESLQSARRGLLAELSSTDSFWEYGGSSTAGWEFANEQEEAERHAAAWCRDRSEGQLSGRLAEGWQVVTSVPKTIESGPQKQLYPDGRFFGYVNYTASCAGTQITLRKDGDLSRLP